jgi:hypothetical protein
MTTANTANRPTNKRIKNVSGNVYTANGTAVSDKDIKKVTSLLTTLRDDGYNYREIANAISRTSGWVHQVINGGRFTVKKSDVIAITSAYRLAQTRKNRTRKHDESVQAIARHCIDILKEAEELSN